MKKIFNDHAGLWFLVTLAVAGTALGIALANRKAIKGHEERLPALKAPETPSTTEETT